MASESDKDDLMSALQSLTDSLETLLLYARQAIQESVEQFIDVKITKLFGLAVVYNKAMKRVNVHTKVDLERKIQHHFRHSDVQEAFEQLQDLESQWDTVLKDVDAHLEKLGPQPLTQGQKLPLDLALVDARSGDTTCLGDFFKAAVDSPEEEMKATQGERAAVPTSASSSAGKAVSAETKRLVLVLLRHFA